MNRYFIWEVIQRSRSEGQSEKQDRRRANIRMRDRVDHWAPSDDGAGAFQGALGYVSQDEGKEDLSSASYALASKPTGQGGPTGADSGMAHTQLSSPLRAFSTLSSENSTAGKLAGMLCRAYLKTSKSTLQQHIKPEDFIGKKSRFLVFLISCEI